MFYLTFHLTLYGIRHMVKNHLDREETCFYHYMGYSNLII